MKEVNVGLTLEIIGNGGNIKLTSIEFQRLQEALRSSPTPEARVAAANAMREYLLSGKSSPENTIMSSSISSSLGGVQMKDVPEKLQNDPEFFNQFGKIMNRERK